jgi:glycerophosphoryl diester phosphodiesterase
MEYAAQNNMKVIPWTVNDKGSMIELLDVGVDGLITDYPDLANDLLKEKGYTRL